MLPMINAEIVKQEVDLLQLASPSTNLKRVADTGGGEWAGPCPFCGGNDRFRVQVLAPPGKRPQGARWMCRKCNPRWGDVIGYVMKRDSVDFPEALQRLTPNADTQQKNENKVQTKKPAEIIRSQWVDTATEFVEESIYHLWGDEGKGALAYLKNRGLSDETLRQWLIGYNTTEGYGDPEQWGLPNEESIWIPKGIVIPCLDESGLHYLKIRRRVGEPKYYIIKGGHSWLFGSHTFLHTAIGFLFEGEFDVMLAEQTGFSGIGYASMPANQQLQTGWEPYFNSIENLIIAFDNDDPGQKGAEKLCRLSSQFVKSDPFPAGNDLSDYYQTTNNIDMVFHWLYDQLRLIGV